MRPKREILCPKCKAPVEPNYLFCLACGEELPLPEGGAKPPEPVELPRKGDATHTCWQCQAKLDSPSPACPHCGADLDKSRDQPTPSKHKKRPRQEKVKPIRATGRRSWLRVATFLLLIIALCGAGAVMLAPKADPEGDGGLSWSSFSGITIPRIFGDDDATAGDKPEGVAVNASEARIVSVADDGLIRVRVDGNEVDVYLAGVSPSFVTQCLGEKALARARRILVDEAIVYVALDGTGEVNATGRVAIQSVYVWQYDPTTGKARFVNQELLGGGEVAYKRVKLADAEPGQALAAANERAKDKERGRYAPGACD